ncbi:MAG: glycosyltransferase family 4 protein [Chloroflexi bacterium]|nr:glycosyltransferase family 4 protein [Chloroflexota bacterium]
MRISIDYTAAARQRAGIGRYTRELVGALLALPGSHQYTLFAATGGLPRTHWQREVACLRAIRNSRFAIRTLPLSDDWLARLWHRLRLPIPVETVTGPLDLFYSPDFVLPPTRRSTRALLTVHDLSFLHYPEHFVPKLVQYLTRVVTRSVARADRVLADSEATRADLIVHLGTEPEKVEVLYSGVDPRFCPQPEPGEAERIRARYSIGSRPYVLSVGTVQPRKNYVRLIQAFAQLQPCKPANLQLADLQLLIAGGKGWLYEDILAEAEKHPNRVRVLGFVDDGDLPALYRGASLFAFPSLYEGFGLPVLEAMACGVPVVCSDVSSLPEVAGDAALLVDPLDANDLVEAMARALEEADLRQGMIAKGLAQAARFSWERAARQLVDTFDALLGT